MDECLTVRTFVCLYCQEDGLDELDLRDHCNEHHASDSKHVVCAVCVQTPNGDPQYYSCNFIGHLNLRHCYYLDDITNLNQTDEMNIQCAILASYRDNY
ncbi:RING finger protein 166 [Carassius auratus]|uniref:RING finger protein 166 n=1 Tax=Carassius auratus TaxID=7957 RepID=A0A6P6RNS1_CARAU|nr:RING finger protein 166-like [Carassius auratus]